jgi:branched-subunit amino acid transport protein AzlD
MTDQQIFITIALVTLTTVFTRFLPYLLFPADKPIPGFIAYLGKVLGPAVFGLLVVYCLRSMSFASLSGWLPAVTASAVTIILYLWKQNMIIPMAGGTICYILLLHLL